MQRAFRVLRIVGAFVAVFAACGGGDSGGAAEASPGGDGGTSINGDGGNVGPDGAAGDGGGTLADGAKVDGAKDDDAGPPHPPVTGLTQFTEITSSSGLATIQSGMVWTFDMGIEDFDGDGKLDVFLGDHDTASNHNRLAHNDGNLTFSNELGTALTSLTGVWSFMAVDANNDGAVDALVNWDAQNSSAFANDNAGGFTKVTSPFDHQANGMAWADYDGDGFLDFAVTNFGGGGNKLWRHKSNGLGQSDFEDKSSAGMITGNSSAATYLADLNGDHKPDLIVQSLTNGTIFQAATGCSTKVAFNTGSGFGAPQTAGLDNAPCYGIALGDFDNDGDLDLAAVGAAAAGSSSAGSGNVLDAVGLFRNDGSGNFTDVTASAKLPTATVSVDVYRHIYDQAVWADLDQDGFLDLILTYGANDKVFRNLGNRTFQDVTTTWKLSAGNGRPERLSVGDLDGDGDVDLVTQSGQAQGYRMWRNDLGSPNWLTIRLEGNAIKTAVSSKIWVYDVGHANDPSYLRGYREVMVSDSHRAPLEQNFGVDSHSSSDVVVRFWPSGASSTFSNVLPGQRLKIRENGTTAQY